MADRLSRYIKSEVLFTPEECVLMSNKHLIDLQTYSIPPATVKLKPYSGLIPQINFPRYTPYYSSARYAVEEGGDF